MDSTEYLKKHDWKKVATIFATLVLYTFTVILNALNSIGNVKPFYISSVGSISNTYYIDITPAGWVFSMIWTIIFTWQFIWLIYAIVCLFRRTQEGELLYRKFDFLHYGIFGGFVLNNLFVIGWLFLWDRLYLGWALLFIVLATLSLYICLVISFRKIYELKIELSKFGFKKDVWFNRFFLQNGIAFYLTWLSLASNLNMAMFIAYGIGSNYIIPSTVALCIILVVVVVYFILENFVWQKYLLYQFTTWFVVIIALIGSLTKNWISSSPSQNNIITLIFLIIIILLAITKIIMFILYKTKLKNRVNQAICINEPQPNLLV